MIYENRIRWELGREGEAEVERKGESGISKEKEWERKVRKSGC